MLENEALYSQMSEYVLSNWYWIFNILVCELGRGGSIGVEFILPNFILVSQKILVIPLHQKTDYSHISGQNNLQFPVGKSNK